MVKGTSLFGKCHNKTHTIGQMCHLWCPSHHYGWFVKVRRQKTIDTGKKCHMPSMHRKFHNRFYEFNAQWAYVRKVCLQPNLFFFKLTLRQILCLRTRGSKRVVIDHGLCRSRNRDNNFIARLGSLWRRSHADDA